MQASSPGSPVNPENVPAYGTFHCSNAPMVSSFNIGITNRNHLHYVL
jgi:hypothetical protein